MLLAEHRESTGKERQALANRKHGFRGKHPKRFYTLWRGIKLRCLTKSSWSYARYGGKGITVCDKWLSFLGFHEDMYKSYEKHVKKFGEYQTTIDRIDNAKGYCKENCRWATRTQQQNNRTTCNYITYKGKRLTVTDWAREFNIKVYRIKNRIKKRNLKSDSELSLLMAEIDKIKGREYYSNGVLKTND